MKKYIKLMRVHHYIKNLLVFAALACSGNLFEKNLFVAATIGFVSMCFVSSAVYVINDIKDREADRLHETKRHRPIASGEISVKTAVFMAVILILLSLGTNCLVYSPLSTGLLLVYLVTNLAYSLGLKNAAIVDVCLLVSGFLIRILYGATITGIEISNWLYLTVIAIAFYFAFGKRRNEIKKAPEGKTRRVLKEYPIHFLDQCMYMSLTLANVFYALWSMDKNTIEHYGSKYLVLTVPLVLIITIKYCMNIEKDSDGDPVEVLVKDKVLITLSLIYVLMMCGILYL